MASVLIVEALDGFPNQDLAFSTVRVPCTLGFTFTARVFVSLETDVIVEGTAAVLATLGLVSYLSTKRRLS